jgi:3-oxoacyl-(acyl-carrier-protein) synthase
VPGAARVMSNGSSAQPAAAAAHAASAHGSSPAAHAAANGSPGSPAPSHDSAGPAVGMSNSFGFGGHNAVLVFAA